MTSFRRLFRLEGCFRMPSSEGNAAGDRKTHVEYYFQRFSFFTLDSVILQDIKEFFFQINHVIVYVNVDQKKKEIFSALN